MTPTRFAIYFVPDPSEAWAQFCTAWLGWDITSSKAVAHPELNNGVGPVSAITAVPRRYGLHATIKPPFRLRAGKSPRALLRTAQDLVADTAPLTLSRLEVSRLSRFLALTVAGETTDLNNMAARMVRGLDDFRAPPSDHELERRRAANLSSAQEENLLKWGYPHVMDQFRFHITLTSKLPKDDLAKTEAALERHLLPNLPNPFTIRELALVGEDEEGFFHLLERLPLSRGD